MRTDKNTQKQQLLILIFRYYNSFYIIGYIFLLYIVYKQAFKYVFKVVGISQRLKNAF